MGMNIRSFRDFEVENKHVLLRLDINSPLDKEGKIVDRTRLGKSVATLKGLLKGGAKVAILAHQGDTLDYQNLKDMKEHAEILSELIKSPVAYIDDVCGPAAIEAIIGLSAGEAVLLGNVRYLAEEISTFETVVKLTPVEMTKTWLVRTLAPLFDLYVNDAFAAAHRSAPSMVAFQEMLPAAAGDLFFTEYTELESALRSPMRPAVFVLGGAKISDAFGMLNQVLTNDTADRIVAVGITGQIFLLAQGVELGQDVNDWLDSRKLLDFVPEAKNYLKAYPDRFLIPLDLAYEDNGQRVELSTSDLPKDDALFLDIGEQTIQQAEAIIASAGSLFINGPAGVYEDDRFAEGTRRIWQAVAASKGHSVLGGGDSLNAAHRFINLDDIDFISSAGGAMVRFMTGQTLPLIAAMEGATRKGDKDSEGYE
ncbi:MAG TPA: phosphoglycerate kinase [Clostridia bacterium]|nr:phosphoglycerate kinase [Clostridia bacterium]